MGQAQISSPASSYRTIPSRMLVLLTAATSLAGTPGGRERLADAGADERPVARRVEDLRARVAGQLRVRPLALADGELAAVGVERMARQLPVPRSIASVAVIGRPAGPSGRAVGEVDERLAARQPLDLGRGQLAAAPERLVRWSRRCG